MRSRGRLRGPTDRSCRSVGKGAIRDRLLAEPTEGLQRFARRCPGLLGTVRSPKDGEAAELTRACARQQRASKKWDALGVDGDESARILDWEIAHLHNPSAGQWKTSRTEGSDLHIPGRG